MISAADRKVIREALMHAAFITANYADGTEGHRCNRNCNSALAILDKPQPESAGDARELAHFIISRTCDESGDWSALETAVSERIQAYGDRIRAATLEGSFIDIRDRAYKNGYDAGLEEAAKIAESNTEKRHGFIIDNGSIGIATRIRSLKPTGTP